MITTTFRKLRSVPACKKRYKHLKSTIPKRYDDDPIDIVEILDANGLEDALWVPEKILSGPDLKMRYRLFAVACCQDVLHLMKDHRSKNTVRAAHLFCHGGITEDELAEARAAAGVAAGVAAWAAWYAAGAEARAAARAAARAVRAAAGVAAWATWYAAGVAATNKQKEHFRRIFTEDFSD